MTTVTEFITQQAAEYAADETLPQPTSEYGDVRDALFEVQRAAGRVLSEDVRQGQRVLAEIAREYPVMQTLIGYLVADGERAVRADLEAAVEELRKVADERLAPHSHVPQRLETQRDEALGKASQLDGVLAQARESTDAGEWQGWAAQGYEASAGGQITALEELAGLNTAAARHLDEAALLHRGTFYLCAAVLRISAMKIGVLQASDPGALFARTRHAISLVQAAAGQLDRDISSAQRGTPAVELATAMEQAVRGAQVLVDPTWPKSGE